MERVEPRLKQVDPSNEGITDWGNVRFRRKRSGPANGSPEENADSRFWVGALLFLAVAAAYPWYSYWVNVYLLTHDLQVAGEELGRQLEASSREAQRQSAANRARREAAAQRARIANVQVLGAVPSQSGPIAIVRLGQASLSEATPTICVQAGAMLRTPVIGAVLRVQRHRGSQPALDIGSIRC